jgi:hypothetical protein
MDATTRQLFTAIDCLEVLRLKQNLVLVRCCIGLKRSGSNDDRKVVSLCFIALTTHSSPEAPQTILNRKHVFSKQDHKQ